MIVSSYLRLFHLLIVRYIIVYNIIDMLKVFIEDLMDLPWLCHGLLAFQVSCYEQHSVLKAIFDLLFIVLHKWPDFLKIPVYEASNYGVFILVHSVSEEILILREKVFQVFVNSKVSEV